MQFEVKELESNVRELHITVDTDELGKIEQKVVQEIQKSAIVPGFRKGKVPVNLVKRRYADVIQAEVLEKTVSTFYGKALDESALKPIAQGKITNIKYEGVDTPLEFDIHVEVEPVIELKKYKGLKLEKEVAIVSDEMVDDALEDMRKHFATVRDIEEAGENSLVTLDMQELGEGGMPVIGRKYESMNIEIGSGQFDPELEKQLVGVRVGDERILRRAPLLVDSKEAEAPKQENYKVTINALQERELPELNDELAKNLQDEEIKTLEQLRQRMHDNIQSNLERRSKQQFTVRLIDELLKENPFEAPNAMVENYLDHVIEDLKERSKKQEIDESMVRQKYRPDAIHSIRWHLLKQKLVEVENLEVTAADITERINSFGFGEEENNQAMHDSHFRNRLQEDLLEGKVLGFLEEHAEIEEVTPQTESALV